MSTLNKQQKQLIFDYCIGLTSDTEAAEAQGLIASNKEGAEIHSRFKAALLPLESFESESCPDDLAQRTILRHDNLARASQLRLQQLLAGEQTRNVTTKTGFWHNFARVAAIAAVLVIFVAVLGPALSHVRQKYRRYQCQMQLARIFQGIGRYSADHDGQLPAVATAAGEPWWKVGYQGRENHSTTRSMWLLVKSGYVDPNNFRCPGRRQRSLKKIDLAKVENYRDFPDRFYVAYSFPVGSSKPRKPYPRGRKVLIADLSPLFESLPPRYSDSLKLRLSKGLLTANSINHNRRGQNILFCDGQVKFVKTRRVGTVADDIFTLQNMCIGCEVKGYEVPSCETDTFLAP